MSLNAPLLLKLIFERPLLAGADFVVTKCLPRTSPDVRRLVKMGAEGLLDYVASGRSKRRAAVQEPTIVRRSVPPPSAPSMGSATAPTNVAVTESPIPTAPTAPQPSDELVSKPSVDPKTPAATPVAVRRRFPQIRPIEPDHPWPYRGVSSPRRTDLIGVGVLSYYRRPWLVLELALDGVFVGRTVIEPTISLLQMENIGMRLPSSEGPEPRVERIQFDVNKQTWGPRTKDGPIEITAPNGIWTLGQALRLRPRDRLLPLPTLPASHRPGEPFFFHGAESRHALVPLVVGYKERETTEPVFVVEWYAADNFAGGDFCFSFLASSLISLSDAVFVAQHGYLFAKLSLPPSDTGPHPGSWYPIRLIGRVDNPGVVTFPRGLDIDLDNLDLPRHIRELVGKSPDIRTIPLNHDRHFSVFRSDEGWVEPRCELPRDAFKGPYVPPRWWPTGDLVIQQLEHLVPDRR